VNFHSPTVRLELQSQPESLTLVRGALIGLGETLEFDPELLDDLKTAVSEACNNVVLHAYPDGSGPLFVLIEVGDDCVEVTVCDRGSGIHAIASDDERMGVGLAVISALAEQAEFTSVRDEGTEVRMVFKGSVGGSVDRDGDSEPPAKEELPTGIDGDVIVSLNPPMLLEGVLGRIARGVAAAIHFSVDRLSDLYLLVDGISDHALNAASTDRVAFAVSGTPRRLDLTIGPFSGGSSASLEADGSRVKVLADELHVEPTDESELLRVVVCDGRSR
jgi:anti-sigma regulatory factor (Ser/Thr protein kinase)